MLSQSSASWKVRDKQTRSELGILATKQTGLTTARSVWWKLRRLLPDYDRGWQQALSYAVILAVLASLEIFLPNDGLQVNRSIAALAPAAEQSHLQLGQELQRHGDWEGALAEYEQAITLRENYPEGWVLRGVAPFSLGRYNEAAQAYVRALQLNPGHGTVHYNLAQILENTGDLEGVRRHYEEALAGRDAEAQAMAREALERMRP